MIDIAVSYSGNNERFEFFFVSSVMSCLDQWLRDNPSKHDPEYLYRILYFGNGERKILRLRLLKQSGEKILVLGEGDLEIDSSLAHWNSFPPALNAMTHEIAEQHEKRILALIKSVFHKAEKAGRSGTGRIH